MKRFKKPKNKTVTLNAKTLQKIKNEVTDEAVCKATLLYLVSMKDEFNYGYEEVERVFIRANRYAEYIDDKVATMKTLAESLEKNTGIKIEWR